MLDLALRGLAWVFILIWLTFAISIGLTYKAIEWVYFHPEWPAVVLVYYSLRWLGLI